jgi:hypothetical protein
LAEHAHAARFVDGRHILIAGIAGDANDSRSEQESIFIRIQNLPALAEDTRSGRNGRMTWPEPLRERYGYPKITPQLRAKVFGLNATKPYRLAAEELRQYTGRDTVAQTKLEYGERPNPSYVTHGPRTRREFLNLRAWHAGEP